MQQRRPDEDERFLRTTLRAVPGHPPGGARSHNENSVPGEQTRTLVHSDSGFTKGWFGVQPERKRTSATAPAIRTTTTDTKQVKRERNPQAHNSKHQPRLVPWKVRKETLRKPVDNRSSFRDSHPSRKQGYSETRFFRKNRVSRLVAGLQNSRVRLRASADAECPNDESGDPTAV